MSATLPHVQIRFQGTRPKVVSSDRRPGLTRIDLDRLLALDRMERETSPGDRAYPLSNGRWAIGRGLSDGFVWRIVSPEIAERLQHPAWLWRSSRWFDPEAPPTGPVPGPLPLRTSIEAARRLTGGSAQCAALLAAMVAGLRAGDRPIAVVLDQQSIDDNVHATRWLLLSLLTLLPKPLRQGLRLSAFEPEPSAQDWDLVLTTTKPQGFRCIVANEPLDVSHDLPATFLLDRLKADALEQAQEASQWLDEGAEDPWASAIERLWDQSAPTLSTPAPSRRPNTRLHLTTPEAWLALIGRPEAERHAAVRSWLETSTDSPTEAALGALSRVRTRGVDTNEWVRALLRWADVGPCAVQATLELGRTLELELLPQEPGVLASIWTEYLLLLLKHGRFSDALAACESPTAHRLIDQGAGHVIVEAWVHLPSSRRPESALIGLVDSLRTAPHGGAALTQLWQALMVDENDGRADLLLQRVAGAVSHDSGLDLTPLLKSLAASPQAMRWVGHVARQASPRVLGALVEPVTNGGLDPLWEHCVDVRAQICPPETQIADQLGMPEAQVQRSERELRDRAADVQFWRFPDIDIADGAARLAEVDDASALWSWIELCARPPSPQSQQTVPTIVTRLCAAPPAREVERRSLWTVTESLGAAGWSPAQFAGLLIRLALAHDTEDGAFSMDLSTALARGIARGPSGAKTLAEVTNHLGTLPDGHPATDRFIRRILPITYARGVPAGYTEAVQASDWPESTHSLWRRVVQSLGTRT